MRVHFVGIGGSSMSGLASLALERGLEVSGSDQTRSHKTDALEASGVKITIGHVADNVVGADLVVYTAAIAEGNLELIEAQRRGIMRMERAEYLGRLMEGYDEAILISGTHGKTTTTAMVAQMFSECGAKPTVHIGGELPALGGSTVLGTNDYFIAEACEFKASFLKFKPTIPVVLNIDEDHLDFYKDIDDIQAHFQRFVNLAPADGMAIGCGDDARVREVLAGAKCKTRTYGLQPFNELRAEDVSYDDEGRADFNATLFGHHLAHVSLSVAGEHNLLNALAALAVAERCALPMTRAAEVLSSFTGAHRRFELTSVTDGVRLYQDYGHNPAEIKNALHIAKLQPHGTLWSVWQPHTYSRTKKLFNGFLETFYEADRVLITDICGAREADPGDISSEMLISPLRERGVDAVLTPTFDDAEAYLRARWRPGDLVITHGCGDIDLLNEQIALHGDAYKG